MRVGVDLLLVDRMGRVADDDRFRGLVFTAAELADVPDGTRSRQLEFLAGRLAAKEAVAKALGCGFLTGLTWRDVEIVRGAQGVPGVRLATRARAAAVRAGVGDIALSISHQGGWVMAVAVATSARPRAHRRRRIPARTR